MRRQEIFNVAVVGAGIGSQHIEGYLGLPDCFAVRTVCDLDTARARDVARGLPECRIVKQIAQVLSDPAIDVVDICLPPNLHFETTMNALSAGKHVVCEKPFATSLADVDRVREAAMAAGREVFPVFQMRHGLGFQRLLRLTDKDLVGRPLVGSVETHWRRGEDYYAVPWRGTWTGECGGAIVGHAIHIHDLVTRVLGPVAKVGALLATRVNPIETEDCAAVALQMASGALVTSSVTLGAALDMSRFRLCFEHVTVESGRDPYDVGGGAWSFSAPDPARQSAVDDEIDKLPRVPVGFGGFFVEMYAKLTSSPGSPTTLDDAWRSMELITAMYHSQRTGTIVSLPLDKTHPLYDGWSPTMDRVR